MPASVSLPSCGEDEATGGEKNKNYRLILNKDLGNVDPAISIAGHSDTRDVVFTVEDVLTMRIRIHPLVDGKTGNVSNSLANKKILANPSPVCDTGFFRTLVDIIAVSIFVVEKTAACHPHRIAASEIG